MTSICIRVLGLTSLALVSAALPSAHASAEGCRVYTGELEWVYEGYPINYAGAVKKVLDQKNYEIVDDAEKAEYLLGIELGTYRSPRFEFATAAYSWNRNGEEDPSHKGQQEKRCWTQFCAVTDFIKPLEKVIARMKNDLPECEVASQ